MNKIKEHTYPTNKPPKINTVRQNPHTLINNFQKNEENSSEEESEREKSPPPGKLVDDINDTDLLTDPLHQLESTKDHMDYWALTALTEFRHLDIDSDSSN